jgi:hypothetical protein
MHNQQNWSRQSNFPLLCRVIKLICFLISNSYQNQALIIGCNVLNTKLEELHYTQLTNNRVWKIYDAWTDVKIYQRGL